MADAPLNPAISTDDPESGTEFGGVDGLVPPSSVHTPTSTEEYIVFRQGWRAARAAREAAARKADDAAR